MVEESFSARMRKKLEGRAFAWSTTSNHKSAEVHVASNISVTRASDVILPDRLLAADERGVVWSDIPSDWFSQAGAVRMTGPVQDEAAIRSSYIFADRFDLAESNLLGMQWPSKSTFESVDAYQSSRVVYDGNMNLTNLAGVAAEAFVALDQREPGRWTIARGSATVGIPQNMLVDGQAFAITLHNALPIFSRSVPLDQIREFKIRHAAELHALRHYMDELIREVAENGVNDLANNSCFERFDRALGDHMRIMAASNSEKVLTSFKASISWDLLVPAGVEIALTHTVASGGVISAAAMLGINTVKGLRQRRDLNPFEYLTIVNRELY